MKRERKSGRNQSQLLRAIESLESRLLLSATRYVDLNSPGPAHDGTSWDTAYLNPQEALAAAVSGDTIRVADGTYTPTSGTDRTISFNLKTGVSLLGGYAGYGAADPNARDIVANATILSGDIGTAGTNTDNSYHVVVGNGTTATAVLDGFTITAGNADGSTSPAKYGGGMYNAAGSPTLTNCTFSSNSAGNAGGGMYNSSSSPALTNCTFIGNSATNSGGGMYNLSSSPKLSNCTFSGNSATRGGGMYNSSSSSAVLTNCIIWGSGSSPLYNNSSTPVITYSDIQGGWTGTGNIDVDPLFVRSPWTGLDGTFGTADDDCGDLHLRAGSPVLDIGSNVAVPSGITTDLAGDPRIQNGIVDMGAYEGATFAPAPKMLYVDIIAPGTNMGTSWTNAFVSLQSALAAATDGDTIRVADGTYTPTSGTDRTISFNLKTGVSLLGGYAGYGAADPNARDIVANVTILSGDIGTIGSNTDNSYHVVVGSGTTASAILDGFAITAGNANGSSSSHYGGGLYNSVGSPTVSNCIFSTNSASNSGGGMYSYSSSPTVSNCTFRGNSAIDIAGQYGRGGAMYNGPSSSTIASNCTFSRNSAKEGGGMYNADSSPTVSNCTFSGNTASTTGAGMLSISSAPTVSNCAFSGNAAFLGGGGIYTTGGSLTVSNCTFASNSAGGWGGGIHSSTPLPTTVSNCILWGNTVGSQIYDAAIVNYSDVQGGWTGAGNISVDPLFVRNPSPGPDTVWGTADDDYGDLRLQIGSPCIDAGSNAAVPTGTTTDLAGDPRFIDVPGVHDPGAIVDMGAYEYTLPLAASGSAFLPNAAKPSVKISFNGDVSESTLTAGDLLLENLASGQPIDCSAVATVAYDPAARSATWSFAGLLADGNYRATLPAGSVSDAGGNPLSTSYSFEFFALAGDANHDRTVDISDLGILATNWQGSAKTFAQGDFNYDGIVDISDLGILATSWQKTLAAPTLPKPAAMRSAAPARVQAVVGMSRRPLIEEVGLVAEAAG